MPKKKYCFKVNFTYCVETDKDLGHLSCKKLDKVFSQILSNPELNSDYYKNKLWTVDPEDVEGYVKISV
jgi:hypothetical protein